ncbi:MAG: hypothetical protein LBT98_01395 [Puniceicoccales bacterium]|jgi:hypothetical protein|nr:hypothetical protein [Puniceicoccales bacterium]
MADDISIKWKAPLALRTVRNISAVATGLAMVGLVTVAVVLFTAGCAVLWPALIGCACLAAVALITLVLAHYFCKKLSAGCKEKTSQEEIPQTREWERDPLKGVDVKTHIEFLANMNTSTGIEDALKQLAKDKNITVSKKDLIELRNIIDSIFHNRFKDDSIGKIKDLHKKELKNFFTIEFLNCKCSDDSIVLLTAFLSLIPETAFGLSALDEGGWQIYYCEPTIDTYYMEKLNGFRYFICNCENQARASCIEFMQGKIGKDHVFLTHYTGEGALVVDGPQGQ